MGKHRSKGKKKSRPGKANRCRKQDQVAEADGMVVLRSNDGLELLVSKLEASQSITIQGMIMFGGQNYLIPFDVDGSSYTPVHLGIDGSSYTPIHLGIEGNVLSKVVEYWKKHASGSRARGDDDGDPNWHSKFIDVDNNTLCELILAASYLRDQGLLDLTCQTVANMIKGKSSQEIRRIFKITSDATRRHEKMVKQFYRMITASLTDPTMCKEPHFTQEAHPELFSIPQKSDLERSRELKIEVNALRALHIVRCQEFTGYDPKLNDFICTRFCDYNIAFFDLDALSMPSRGPPLRDLREPKERRIVQSSVNVISLKVARSDLGYPLIVFGTVLARDEFDYRCVYLFRRSREDAQVINSPDDMLTLTDPCRGIDASDKIYFEIDLKIKTGGGGVKDFSKGLLVFNSLCFTEGIMTGRLTSRLSSVKLTYVHVPCPVEATIAINILKGPCNISRVDAAISGNIEDHFISLYDIEAGSTGTVTGNGGSLVLTRRVLAVPLDQKLVLTLVDGDKAEHVVLSLGQCGHKEQLTCKLGCAELQVEVAWTAIPRRKREKWEVIGGERLLQ